MNLLELFLVFLKIGAVSFGGGFAMIPFFENEMVAHNWVSLADYVKVIAIAQVIPGPFGIDSSAYIGYRAGGFVGAVVASAALCIPSFTASVLISKFYTRFRQNIYVNHLLNGVRPAVLGLLISAVYIIGVKPISEASNTLYSLEAVKALIFVGVWFLILNKFKLNTLLFFVGVALTGIIIF